MLKLVYESRVHYMRLSNLSSSVAVLKPAPIVSAVAEVDVGTQSLVVVIPWPEIVLFSMSNDELPIPENGVA